MVGARPARVNANRRSSLQSDPPTDFAFAWLRRRDEIDSFARYAPIHHRDLSFGFILTCHIRATLDLNHDNGAGWPFPFSLLVPGGLGAFSPLVLGGLGELSLFPFGLEELSLFPSPTPQTAYPTLIGLIGIMKLRLLRNIGFC